MIFGKKKETDEKPGDAKAAAKAASAAAGAGDKLTARPRNVRQARMAQNFAQVVAVLMRDANFKNMRIADLEWLVLPPIMSGQFRLAHAATQTGKEPGKEQGPLVPIAVALWATVSPNVDKQLSSNLDKPMALAANQWASGNIVWLMAVAGDHRALPTFLKQLEEKEFKGKEVKLRARDKDGKVVVKTLGKAA